MHRRHRRPNVQVEPNMSNPTRRTQHPPLELKPNATRLVCIAVTGVRETPEPNMMNPTRIPTARTQPPPLELKLNAAHLVHLAVTGVRESPEPNTSKPNPMPPVPFVSLSLAFSKSSTRIMVAKSSDGSVIPCRRLIPLSNADRCRRSGHPRGQRQAVSNPLAFVPLIIACDSR